MNEQCMLGRCLAAGEMTDYAGLRHCSGDLVEVWHGMAAPAIACGAHATYEQASVFRAHRLVAELATA